MGSFVLLALGPTSPTSGAGPLLHCMCCGTGGTLSRLLMTDSQLRSLPAVHCGLVLLGWQRRLTRHGIDYRFPLP
jgi:hypothetical protein